MRERLPKLFKRGDKRYKLIHKRKFSLWDQQDKIDMMKQKYDADVILRQDNYILFLKRIEFADFTEITKELEEKSDE